MTLDEHVKSNIFILAAFLKEIRERRGLSQNKVSQQIPITHSYVSRIESAERSPSIRVVHKWLDVCNASSDERARAMELCGAVVPNLPVWIKQLADLYGDADLADRVVADQYVMQAVAFLQTQRMVMTRRKETSRPFSVQMREKTR